MGANKAKISRYISASPGKSLVNMCVVLVLTNYSFKDNVRETYDSITLSACPNIGQHPLPPCHALMWNLWLPPVNEAYWEPVGRYLSALPRFRWTHLGQLSRLSDPSGPPPSPSVVRLRINTSGPVFTYMTMPLPLFPDNSSVAPPITPRYNVHSVWPAVGFPCAFVKLAGLSQTHTHTDHVVMSHLHLYQRQGEIGCERLWEKKKLCYLHLQLGWRQKSQDRSDSTWINKNKCSVGENILYVFGKKLTFKSN